MGSRNTRPGDSQPPPVVSEHAQMLAKSVQYAVMCDIGDRSKVGYERYGTYLFPNNGRDALTDAYEEALDLCMYLKQAIVERDGGGAEA